MILLSKKMKMFRLSLATGLTMFFIFFLAAPSILHAVDYVPLVPDSPLTAATSAANVGAFLLILFKWGVSLAVALAILFVIYGGVEYMTTDAVFKKEEGRKRITAAVAGLLIVFASWLILQTVDPKILTTTITLQELGSTPGGGSTGGGSGGNSGGGSPTPPGTPVNYVPGDPNAIQGLAAYQQAGWVTVTDNSGRTGQISPEVAWMRDTFPGQFPGLISSSTYRSPEHNHAVGGGADSDHVRGEAVDFYNSGLSAQQFSQRGNQMVDYMLANGRALGADQIIFENRNYRWNSNQNTWVAGGVVPNHNDHVHIGR